MSKKLLFVCQQLPYSNFAAKESLDAALAATAFGLEVSLLFKGDGVYQLLARQDASLLGRKSVGAALGALELYDITQVYACEHALRTRRIDEESRAITVQALSETAIRALYHDNHHILSF